MAKVIHGMCGTRTYRTWTAMITRCTNSNFPFFRNYGGRGIKICDRWRQSFENFLEDMGERPSGTSIERKDVNGDYCPENCCWATAKEQGRNTRTNKFVKYNGESRTVAEWAEIVGLDPITLNKRLRRGWPVSVALSQPNGGPGIRPLLTSKQSLILDCLFSGPKRLVEVVTRSQLKRGAIDDGIAVLLRIGYVDRVSVGTYAITGAGQRAMPLTRDR